MKHDSRKRIDVPRSAVMLLVGISSCGKSSFATQWFPATWRVSSDHYRAVISDSEEDMNATDDAFGIMGQIVEARCRRGLASVVDAMNIEPHYYEPLLTIAAAHRFTTVAVLFDTPYDECARRHRLRTDRNFDEQKLVEMQHWFRIAKGKFIGGRSDFVVEAGSGNDVCVEIAPTGVSYVWRSS